MTSFTQGIEFKIGNFKKDIQIDDNSSCTYPIKSPDKTKEKYQTSQCYSIWSTWVSFSLSFFENIVAQNIGQIIEVLWVWKRISLLVKTWKMNNRTFIFINKHGIIQSRKSFSVFKFNLSFSRSFENFKNLQKAQTDAQLKWVYAKMGQPKLTHRKYSHHYLMKEKV